MFERAHHQRIEHVLSLMDSELFGACNCWFGGGTAIVLRYGEYRESRDIDFLVSDPEGYRQMRRRLADPDGIRAFFLVPGAAIMQHRGLRADRYGIRARFDVAGVEIKFEVVVEGHIELDTPSADDRICGVRTLTPLDMAATKLMANADRWADDGTFNRDLLDLAMIDLGPEQLRAAAGKAQSAYGDDIQRNLGRAIERLREREGWMQRCLDQLQFLLPKALVWERIRTLQRRLMAG